MHSASLISMAGVGVAHKLIKKKKKKKKKKIQIFDKATSFKTIYKQSPVTGKPSHVPAQPQVFIFWTYLNPSTVFAETASVVSPLQVALKKEKISPSVYALGRWYREGWDLVTPVTSSLRQVPCQ